MTNHNLNYEIDLLGNAILVPYIPLLPMTNNVTGIGSLGVGVQECIADWGRPPKFLDVDFYDVGNGSVFEVAAMANGVTYNRTCCGLVTSWGEVSRSTGGLRWTGGIILAMFVLGL